MIIASTQASSYVSPTVFPWVYAKWPLLRPLSNLLPGLTISMVVKSSWSDVDVAQYCLLLPTLQV